MSNGKRRVAIVGGGISGLIHAHVLRKNGFEAVVFEKSSEVEALLRSDALGPALDLDVRLRHEVVAAEELPDGWSLTTLHDGVRAEERFDLLVVAIGQYTEGKHRPRFDGEERFRGHIGTERDARYPHAAGWR